MRAFNRQTIRNWTLTGLTLLTPVMVYGASQVGDNGLYIFAPNTKIVSAEVNENFAQVDGRIKTYENVISVDALSNIGIGTKTPGAKLDIAGPGSAAIVTRADGSRYAAMGDTGGTDDGGVFLYNNTGTLQSVIRAQGDSYIQGGSVGIGTASPASPLHVMGNGLPTLTLETAATASGSSAGIELITKEQESWTLAANGGDDSFGIRSGLDANDTLFYLSSDGNVGIGTTYPSARLHVSSAQSGMAVPAVLKLDAWNGASTAQTAIVAYGVGSGWMALRTGGADRVNIDSSGKVGIGTTSPISTLDVKGDIRVATLGNNGNGTIILNGQASATESISGNTALGVYILSGGSERVRVTTNGNVGIGLTAPSYPLDVNGKIRVETTVYSSDARLKRDIRPLTHALEGIQCLQGVSYYLRDPASDQGLQLGVIAQEVERCYPELVSTDPEGYKSVSYDRLVAPLIEAVKEQQNTITTLQAKDMTQQAQIASLEARLSRLEKLLPTVH